MADYFMPEGMPVPGPDKWNPDWEFWQSLRRHELVVQQCDDCGTFRHTPEFLCYNCHSYNFHWQKVSGKGVVFSYVNVVYPVHPASRDKVPFNIVLVELPDAGNVRMLGNMVDCEYKDIHIGMPVEVVYEDHPEEEVTLALWKKA